MGLFDMNSGNTAATDNTQTASGSGQNNRGSKIAQGGGVLLEKNAKLIAAGGADFSGDGRVAITTNNVDNSQNLDVPFATALINGTKEQFTSALGILSDNVKATQTQLQDSLSAAQAQNTATVQSVADAFGSAQSGGQSTLIKPIVWIVLGVLALGGFGLWAIFGRKN